MFKNRVIFGVLIAAIAMIFSGCGEYEKLLKGRDYKKKYEMGVKLIEEEEFVKSATLFDQVANIFMGTTKADTV